MGLRWKRFWCAHIWKCTKTVDLRKERVSMGIQYTTKTVEAVYLECIKCGRERIHEQYKGLE